MGISDVCNEKRQQWSGMKMQIVCRELMEV
jgi:hypothetical protein